MRRLIVLDHIEIDVENGEYLISYPILRKKDLSAVTIGFIEEALDQGLLSDKDKNYIQSLLKN